VPILILDKTEYVYSPAQSFHCQSLNDVQMAGVAEFPQNIGENSHINVVGKLYQAVGAHEYTQFLINVTSILQPVGPH